MSINQYHVQADDNDEEEIDFGDFGAITPTLKSGDYKVQPVYTEELEGTTSGNGEEHQDMCGTPYYEKLSDSNWRVTISGVVTLSQLNELKKMNPADQEVKVISNGHTGHVEFDRFTWTQTSDLNYGVFFIDGEEIKEPLFKFQLQTKQNEQ